MICTKEELHAFLSSRRSVRRFLSDPVSSEILTRVLTSAGCAPSAHNRQPWRTALVRSFEGKAKLADAMGADLRRDLLADGVNPEVITTQVERSRCRIVEAPVVIVLSLDMSEMDIFPDEKRSRAEHMMGVQSVALFGGTLLLAAHAEGLGAVWICAPLFAPQAVSQALELPEGWEPQGLLLLGFPAVVPEPRSRKEISEFTISR